eukprot:Pgem_evm1s18835
MSGSMRTCDVENHKTRSDAVYYTIATDLIATTIDQQHPGATEVASLIQMGTTATRRIDKELISNVLYNRMLDIMETDRPSYGGN